MRKRTIVPIYISVVFILMIVTFVLISAGAKLGLALVVFTALLVVPWVFLVTFLLVMLIIGFIYHNLLGVNDENGNLRIGQKTIRLMSPWQWLVGWLEEWDKPWIGRILVGY